VPGNISLKRITGVSALGVNSSAWVVTEAGDFQVPAIEIPWWDTQANKQRIAKIPARTLSVAAGTVQSGGQPSQPDRRVENMNQDTSLVSAGLWPWVSAGLATAWLMTLLLLVRASANNTEAPQKNKRDDANLSQLFSSLDKACKHNQAQEARELLQKLASLLLPEYDNPGIRLLGTIAEPALQTSLEQLDGQLFSANASTWNGSELASALKQLRADLKHSKLPRGRLDLPPLYTGSHVS
jgi:hypothetical protein